VRLSEHVMLGSLLVIPWPRVLLTADNRGCAIGMASESMGGKGTTLERETQIEEMYPWVKTYPKEAPCKCFGAIIPSYLVCIEHLFDSHVFPIYHPSKLEQLVDWIRSVEPPEPDETSEIAVTEYQMEDSHGSKRK
jgi:hypothetical protein